MRDRNDLSSACLATSGEGLAVSPAGGAMLSAMMKSSRFIDSDVEMFCSDDLRSCAMPLGAFCVEVPSLFREKKCRLV